MPAKISVAKPSVINVEFTEKEMLMLRLAFREVARKKMDCVVLRSMVSVVNNADLTILEAKLNGVASVINNSEAQIKEDEHSSSCQQCYISPYCNVDCTCICHDNKFEWEQS